MESTLFNQTLDMESSSDKPTMIQQQMIEAYDQSQTLRMEFKQMVADLSINSENMKVHQKEKMISQLRLFMLDEDPSIQHNAVLALGRLVEHSEELARIVVKKDILHQLIWSIPSQPHHYKKATVFVLHAVAKHSPELSQAVVDSGGLDILVSCLGAVDPEVKEAAAWALAYIAQQNTMLSQAVVDAGAASLLLSLHTNDLDREEVNTGTIALLKQMIRSPDVKLKRQVLFTLIQISKHSVELAEMVIAAYIFPDVMICLQDPDEYVKKDVITLMWEVVKHSAQLSQVIVNCDGLVEVVDYLDKSRGSMRLPGIMMLGYVASHSENLAMAVILSKGLQQLAICLSEEDEDHIKEATVWSIGQIGHHTPEHANAVATAGLLPKLLQFYTGASSLEDLRLKSKKALKNILLKCTHLPSLEPLLSNAPSNILNHVLGQFSKVMHHDSEACQEFVMSGGLSKIQEMDAEPGSAQRKLINSIKSCIQEASANRLRTAKTQHTPLPPRTPATRTPACTQLPKPFHDPTPNPRGGTSRRAKTQHTPLPPRTPATKNPVSTRPLKPIHAPTSNPQGGPREPPIRDSSRRTKTQHTPLPPRTPATRTPACSQPSKPILAPTPNPRRGPREPSIQGPSRRAKIHAQGKTSEHPPVARSKASRCKTLGPEATDPKAAPVASPLTGTHESWPITPEATDPEEALVANPPTGTQEPRPITPEATDLEATPVASPSTGTQEPWPITPEATDPEVALVATPPHRHPRTLANYPEATDPEAALMASLPNGTQDPRPITPDSTNLGLE